MLAGAGVTLLLLIMLNLTGWERLWAYLGLGLVLWYFVLQSGVHATLAGVALACAIPLRRTPGRPEAAESPLIRLEHALHPWVAFAVVPVFGFANAGVSFLGLSGSAFFGPVPLGIAAGLFLGKQLGIFAFAWAAIRANLADLPANATWAQVYGVAVLCGIGFTMSLFIGLLAFPTSAELQDATKVGVLAGSFASAAIGAALLTIASRNLCRSGREKALDVSPITRNEDIMSIAISTSTTGKAVSRRLPAHNSLFWEGPPRAASEAGIPFGAGPERWNYTAGNRLRNRFLQRLGFCTFA